MSQVKLLLIEDNPADQLLVDMALKDSAHDTQMQVFDDGESASDFLFRRGNYQGADRPDVIILDINVPRKSGKEIIAELAADPILREIPIVVMSGSKAPVDITFVRRAGAVSYVTKPASLERFLCVIQAIEEFAIKRSQSPEQTEALIREFNLKVA